jgi:hypothetical protein
MRCRTERYLAAAVSPHPAVARAIILVRDIGVTGRVGEISVPGSVQ